MEMRGRQQIRADCNIQLLKTECTEELQISEVLGRVENRVLERRISQFGMQSATRRKPFNEAYGERSCERHGILFLLQVIGVPQPQLKWFKDGQELNPGDMHKIISGQSGTCCLGTYTCQAHNCMGTVSSSATLLTMEGTLWSVGTG